MRVIEYLNLFLLCVGTLILIALQQHLLGWGVLGIGLIGLLFCNKEIRKHFFLVYISVAILGFTEISTDISYLHMVEMGAALSFAVAIPYLVSRYLYKDRLVNFKFHHGRNWYKTEIGYIALTATISYFLLPFFLRDTQSYLNWTVEPGVHNLARLFVGTNALGIWDELFFVSTVLGIFRRFMNFHIANIAQSILFTSFLYELGFKGWGFVMIFIFAIIQGYVFRKTESLFYVIAIHLTLDLILYLALIHAHHPSWIPIFFT